MGQRQDLALAIFLARARGVKGTFFLDEPVIHLDDLNRVALMDTFRMLVLESEPHCNFIITTARRDSVRHMAEKFANVPPVHGMPPLRIYELDGSPRVGVRVAKEWCSGVG
jgi:energy-coupling factor transporter ATP-binding protein EcfA2